MPGNDSIPTKIVLGMLYVSVAFTSKKYESLLVFCILFQTKYISVMGGL